MCNTQGINDCLSKFKHRLPCTRWLFMTDSYGGLISDNDPDNDLSHVPFLRLHSCVVTSKIVMSK